MKLLLASNNEKKRAELLRILAGFGLEPVTPREAGIALDPDENGDTFAANARSKALAFSAATALPVLADDSGLEVDALGGAPGVRSARFAGAHGDDAANRRKLLEALATTPAERRGGRFVCALCLAQDRRILAEVESDCRGRMLTAERGAGGFGYDPLFLHEPSGRTFAELDATEKDAVSHRGRALRALVPHLPHLAAAKGRSS